MSVGGDDDYTTTVYIGGAVIAVTTLVLARSLIVSGAKAAQRFTNTVAGVLTRCRRTPLHVTAIAPAQGPTAGNTNVQITGTGFLAGATVTIGATPATGVIVVDAQTITATTALHAAGGAGVTVANTNGDQDTLVNGYTYYLPPVVLAIAPAAGPTDGGQQVVITGTDFVAGATVTIAGVAANVTAAGANAITATTGAHAVGQGNVVVTNPDGQSHTLPNAYDYVAPVVTAVAPNGGTTAGGTHATITGDHFVDGAAVTFDGQAAGNVQFTDAQHLDATTPAHLSGPVNVVVTNPSNDAGTLVRGYLYRLPTLTGVVPATVPYYGGTPITLTGTEFAANATVAAGGAACGNVVVVDATTITAVTPALAVNAGSVNVAVTNSDGNFTGPVALALQPLAIAGLDVQQGTANGGTRVVLTGTAFNAGATVTFDGLNANNVVRNSDTQLTVDTPAYPHGTQVVDVVVTNPDGETATSPGAFAFFARPAIVSITPNSGPLAGGTTIKIRGSDFSVPPTVRISGQVANAAHGHNDDAHTTTVITPQGNAGPANVQVTNGDGQSDTLVGGFTYDPAPPPRNVVIYPAGHDRGSLGAIAGNDGSVGLVLDELYNLGEVADQHVAAALQVRRVPYHRHVAGGTGGILFVQLQHTRHGDAHNVHQVLDVTMTRADNAYVRNLIVTPNGEWFARPGANPQPNQQAIAGYFAQGQAIVNAINAAMALQSVCPATGPVGGGWTIDLYGRNFPADCEVTFGGTPSAAVARVGPAHLTAQVPARLAGAGVVYVRVTDPDGVSVELQNAFRYQALAITAIAPVNGPVAGGDDLEIGGTGFETGATVTVGGNALVNPVVNGPTSISGTVPAGAGAGQVQVAVTNPGAPAVTSPYTYF